MNNLKKISVLIPDGEDGMISLIVNGLSLAKSVDIYVMSNKKTSHIQYSRYVKKYIYHPKSTVLDWIHNIDTEIDKNNIDVILPIFELAFKNLIEHKHVFKNKDKLCLLSSSKDFSTAGNKGMLAKHCDDNDIPFPKTYTVPAGGTTENINIKVPVIVKPEEGFGGGDGIKEFVNREDLNSYFNTNKFDYPYLVQDYIIGYDIDISVLCKQGEILAFTIQTGTLEGKNKFSPKFGVEFRNNSELYKVAEKLMKSLNWSGIAHIDMRFDENSGIYNVIEINPRFWYSVDASIIAGVNFPYLYCLASLNQAFEKPRYELMKYLSIKGVGKTIKGNLGFIFDLKFLFNNTSLKYSLKDPFPMLYIFNQKIKDVFFKKSKGLKTESTT